MKPRNPPCTGLLFLSCQERQMPFQVVELRLDAEDQVTIPSASTRLTLSKSSSRGWTRRITRLERDFWSAVAKDGKTRLKFVIEGV